jgi:transposase
MRLTDEQWEVLEPLIPDPPCRPDGRGRPWRDKRSVLEGILWVLRSGARWKDLPDDYPPYQTCHRRFQHWVQAGVFAHIAHRLATDLVALGWSDFAEWFIDGTFVPAKKGGSASGKPNAAKARS